MMIFTNTWKNRGRIESRLEAVNWRLIKINKLIFFNLF